MITELQENGNISQYLAKKPRANRTRLLLDVAFGMQFLHENGIIHGSLKPSNILITDNGESCIADCGMIMAVPSADTFSHHYYSPEMWEGMITPYSDVYAFGMCMFDVLTSERPWGNLPYDRIRQLVVEQDKRPNRPEGEAWDIRTIPDDIWNLLRRAWVRVERARPGFAEIIS
ncbi:kinase-like domain-containing protein, partial [Cantharellus anzutake]|uniref:kinase-like domain-containing protein n=1 Tax=Cantharellus anzutake TaxID=1750568 RepID=UPI001907A177